MKFSDVTIGSWFSPASVSGIIALKISATEYVVFRAATIREPPPDTEIGDVYLTAIIPE